MNQKTFKMRFRYFRGIPKVGDKVILMERTDIRTNKSEFYCIPDNGEGACGNMNPSIKRYHGWRGTSDNIERFAHGLRRVEMVQLVGLDTATCEDVYKIRVGKDILPDAE